MGTKSKKRITRKQAQRRLREKVKSIPRDKGRLAKNVATSDPKNQDDIRFQNRWFTDPRRMDFEGVDAPEGSATPSPQRKKREPKAKLEKPKPRPKVTPQIAPIGEGDIAEARARVEARQKPPKPLVGFDAREFREEQARAERSVPATLTDNDVKDANVLGTPVEIVQNEAIGRIQLKFDQKPSDAVRTLLKDNFFRWNGRNQAWQRKLNFSSSRRN